MRPQDIAEYALGVAGGDGCVVVVDEVATAHVRFAAGALTTNGSARDRVVTVVCVGDDSVGAARRSGAVDAEEIDDVVAEARFHASAAPAAATEPLVGGGIAAGWDAPPGDVEIGAVGAFAEAVAGTVGASALSGYAEQQVRTTYLASSTGLRRRHEQPTGIVDLLASAPRGASAWTGIGGESIAGVDVVAMRAELEQRLAWPGRRRELRPGKYDVLLAPVCVADLMRHLYGAAVASNAIDGIGVFGHCCGGIHIGDRITAAHLTLRSDPAEPGLACAPFTVARASSDRVSVLDNGLPLGASSWITDGVLTALVQTRRTATLSGQAATGAIDNLLLEGRPGAPGLDQMIAATDHGLLVTSLWYVRDVDRGRLLLTGTSRDGVYLIEGGEVTGVVPDFRFNESPLDVLARTVEVGGTVRTIPREWGDYFTRTAMPPLRVEEFDVSFVAA